MKKRLLCLLVAFCLLPLAALGDESAYLSGDDLRRIEPEYETFLEKLADVLIEKELLAAEEREQWLLYQLGDFLQNGGYGTIAAMYTPGLLAYADESVTIRRFDAATAAGTLTLETLRRYAPSYSSLPGLPLDTELNAPATGEPVGCRFRWTAASGMLMIWDGNDVVQVGSTYISDGRPLYWFEQPVDDCTETLRLELLRADEDVTMATVTLTLTAQDGCWLPEVLK